MYCLSKKDSAEVASGLRTRHIMAECYHGDMTSESRTKVHSAWTSGSLEVTLEFLRNLYKVFLKFLLIFFRFWVCHLNHSFLNCLQRVSKISWLNFMWIAFSMSLRRHIQISSELRNCILTLISKVLVASIGLKPYNIFLSIYISRDWRCHQIRKK